MCNNREFQTHIQPQRPGRISNASQKGHLLVNIEYPFEHGEVINYTLDGVSIHSVTTKIQAFFLIKLPERKETAEEFPHEANGDFKVITEFNGCDRSKRKMVHFVVTPQY